MKKFYNAIINLFLKFITKIDNLKVKLIELISIRKKRKIYKNVKLTKEQQSMLDEYWKKNYGKTISNKWHRLYYATNGIFNVEYVPEIIYSTKLEPKFNDYYQVKFYGDKNNNDILFNNKIEGVRTPKTFLFSSFGKFYDGNRNLISKENAIKIFSELSNAVIKPTRNSSSGNNVQILNIVNGVNVKSGETVLQLIDKYKTNFVVQEKIIPHVELKTLYSNSINTLRVISYAIEDKICVCPVSLRIGGNGSEVDNIHAGGMSIGVRDDGSLYECAYRLGYGDKTDKYYSHPNSNVVFKGYKFTFIDKVIDTAKKLHNSTLGVGIISWDFTVNSDNEVIVIEANYKGQSSWFPQILSGESMFKGNTDKVLNLLKRK